jgi:ABC-type branched-subunit amino acid transport system substrate-binding protein
MNVASVIPGRGRTLDLLIRACLAAICLIAPVICSATTYDLGGMYTYHYRDGRYADWGDYALQGARIAIDEVNASGILGEDKIRLKPENTIDYHCWPDNAALMTETLMQKDILVLTGADCSGPAVEMAKVAERYGVPVISNGANASELSSTEAYPWFVRVVSPSEAYEGYLVDVAAHYGAQQIAHLHTTDAWGMGARRVIDDYAERHGIKVAKRYGYARDTGLDVIRPHLEEIRKAGIRDIVMTGPTPDTVVFFRGLSALGMNEPGYRFYTAEMISADEGADAVYGGFGYLAPMVELRPSEILSRFRQALESRLGHEVDSSSKAFFYGALSYDHILAVAYAIRDIKADGKKVDRENMLTYLRRMDFEGATGRIRIEPGSNDRADMPIQIVNNQGYKADGKTVNFVSVGRVDPETGKLHLDEDKIAWPGSRRDTP